MSVMYSRFHLKFPRQHQLDQVSFQDLHIYLTICKTLVCPLQVGDKLTGQTKYTIHFDKDEIPPAKAFWSISMYDAKSSLFIVNDINRYVIGDRTQGLKYNDDKSLDIIIQHDKPSDTSNWLPAPKDDFYLAMRI